MHKLSGESLLNQMNIATVNLNHQQLAQRLPDTERTLASECRSCPRSQSLMKSRIRQGSKRNCCLLGTEVLAICRYYREWGKKNLLFITDSFASAISLQVYFCRGTRKGINVF